MAYSGHCKHSGTILTLLMTRQSWSTVMHIGQKYTSGFSISRNRSPHQQWQDQRSQGYSAQVHSRTALVNSLSYVGSVVGTLGTGDADMKATTGKPLS